MTRVILLPAAKTEIRRAARWYRDQRRGLDLEFRDEVERVLELIAELPQSYPTTYRGLRRALTRRFPYKIYYRQRGEIIQILALRHHRQRPSPELDPP